jgi:protein phosphatase
MDIGKFLVKKKGYGDKNTSGATDVGKIRDNNEDYFLVLQEKNLYIVSDGMGGQNAGEVASFNASKAVEKYFTEVRINKMRGNPELIKKALIYSVINSHKVIINLQRQKPEFGGMGCTIIVAFIDKDTLHLCHIGDTRAYLLHKNELKLLTVDHSQVMELVKQGLMTLEDAKKSSMKNQLRQAIGAPMNIAPEYNSYKIGIGDKLLLCSDGLWDTVSEDNIKDILLSSKSVKEICNDLIKKANMEGGHDNITVLVVNYQPDIKKKVKKEESSYGILLNYSKK